MLLVARVSTRIFPNMSLPNATIPLRLPTAPSLAELNFKSLRTSLEINGNKQLFLQPLSLLRFRLESRLHLSFQVLERFAKMKRPSGAASSPEIPRNLCDASSLALMRAYAPALKSVLSLGG